jgi:hypothetical protein
MALEEAALDRQKNLPTFLPSKTKQNRALLGKYRAKPSGTEQDREKPRLLGFWTRAGLFWRPAADLTRANLTTSPTATSYKFQRRIATTTMSKSLPDNLENLNAQT